MGRENLSKGSMGNCLLPYFHAFVVYICCTTLNLRKYESMLHRCMKYEFIFSRYKYRRLKCRNLYFYTFSLHTNGVSLMHLILCFFDSKLSFSTLDEGKIPGSGNMLINWRPSLSIGNILVEVKSILEDPNPNSPATVDASKMFRKYV